MWHGSFTFEVFGIRVKQTLASARAVVLDVGRLVVAIAVRASRTLELGLHCLAGVDRRQKGKLTPQVGRSAHL